MTHEMESFLANADFHWERFDNSQNCFESGTELSQPIHIIDIPSAVSPSQNPVPLRFRQCTNLKTLEECLVGQDRSEYRVRLISACQTRTWSKLHVNKPMLRRLMEHHGIGAGFLDLPLSFFSRRTNEEESFCVPWTISGDASAFEIFYTFRYAEPRNDLPNEPWVIRQAGVYQKYDSTQNESVIFLISNMPNSVAHHRAIESLSNHQFELVRNPLVIHNAIHAAYFMRWRDYMAEYERRLLKIADTTMATLINKPLPVNYDTLTSVRSLESKLLPLRAILTSFEEVVTGLEMLGSARVNGGAVPPDHQQLLASHLQSMRRYCQAYIRTSLFLQQRSEGVAKLLADTLAFRNQGVAQEQNGSMLLLTRSAVFITVITLFYLPWTLLTGIFGMEFFELDQETQQLKTSPQIWVFFVTAVGITIVTMLLYYVKARPLHANSKALIDETAAAYVSTSLKKASTDLEKNVPKSAA